MAHLLDVVVKGDSPTTDGQLLASTTADAAAWSSAVHPTATTATLANGWVGASGQQAPAHWRDAFGVVHLDGVGDGSSASFGTLFTLPVGSRPSSAVRFLTPVSGGATAVVSIDTSGNVSSNNTTAFQPLDGITFRSW